MAKLSNISHPNSHLKMTSTQAAFFVFVFPDGNVCYFNVQDGALPTLGTQGIFLGGDIS